MKKVILIISITFSLITFIPSVMNAIGPCTTTWTVHQEYIDYTHAIGMLGCDNDAGCFTEVELAHNIASAANDIAWSLCCVSGVLFLC